MNEDLEKRVLARTAQLEAANRELEAFSYSVSHDLRAPLRAIDGFSRILSDEYGQELSKDAQHYLERVRDNTRTMSSLIDNLLSFSRLSRQPLKKQPIDPTLLARQCLDTLREGLDSRPIEINLQTLPPCEADPALLKQVFFNLLSNAIKFSSKNPKPTIEVGCLQENNESIYFVKDNGVGFDMQYAHKLFGVFQRLHRAEDYEGTGVGLAIVQRIIHRHGGRIWALSEPNQGATFCFTLEGAGNHG
jgi:light-regulated signal transduction histidine kinase (bacteriophytochrome)